MMLGAISVVNLRSSWPSLGLAIAYYAGDDQIGVIHNRAKRNGKSVAGGRQ